MRSLILSVALAVCGIATAASAADQRHIVCYGTSLTSHGAWVDQLKTELNRRAPNSVTITNSGGSGKYSAWGVQNLKSRVIDKKPDVVLIEFAINDAVDRFKCSPDQAKANLDAMIDQIERALPRCQVVLQVMNPAIGKPAASRPHLEKYYQMYRDVAAARKLLLIDHGPKWKTVLDTGEAEFRKVVPDGVHPNVEGCQQHITPTIVEALSVDAAEQTECAEAATTYDIVIYGQTSGGESFKSMKPTKRVSFGYWPTTHGCRKHYARKPPSGGWRKMSSLITATGRTSFTYAKPGGWSALT